MKRTDLLLSKDNQEDIVYHLARYKFASKFLKSTDDILEIGCGTGYGSRFLSNHCHYITAEDNDEETIKYAIENYKKSNINYVTDVNFGDKQYDAAICFEVIEHMTRNEAIKLMQKICLSVKDNGLVFISTPRKTDKVSENRKKFHVHEYNIYELKEDLEDIFSNALIFSQIDESIGTYNYNAAWNFVAICVV